MEEIEHAYKIFLKLNGRNPLEHLGLDRRVILK
jgi:hypothetical protein